MASMSNYLEGQLIKHLFRTGSYTKPTVIAIALCTAAPTDASTGATITEVANSGSYARVELNPDDANWDAISGNNGTTLNTTDIDFPTATGDWGTITHIAVLDSSTHGAGNMLFYGSLGTSKIVGTGDSISFVAGEISIQIDN